MQKGFVPVILLVGLLIIFGAFVGGYHLGKKTNQEPKSLVQEAVTTPGPPISTISTPANKNEWTSYTIKKLNVEFRLPPELARKYGTLVEKETKGERGTELQIGFGNDSKSLKIASQSLEYTPFQEEYSEDEARGIAGGPGISTPAIFQGSKYENELFYGLQPLGKLHELPRDQVTMYHANGRDILKVKALFTDFGNVHQIFPEKTKKIWGIISGTGNQAYSGLTIEGILSDDLTEELFEQILSTFNIVLI